jgi:hypothetical protein
MSLVRTLATPATVATWLVMAVTGVMLFFHLGENHVKEMHEWFGLTMVAAASLHLVKNWPALKAYPKRGPALFGALGVAAVGAAAFVGASFADGEHERGPGAVFGALEKAPLAELAPLFDTTPDALAARLTAAGLEGVAPDATPRSIGEASGMDGRAVLDRIAER